MNLRTFLLVGSAFAMAAPLPVGAGPLEPGVIQLAQNGVCPEGQECPPGQDMRQQLQQRLQQQQGQQAGDEQGGQQQHSRRRSQQQQQGQQQDQGAPEQQGQQAGDDQGGQQQHSRRRSQQQQQQGQQQGAPDQQGQQAGDDQGGQQQHSRRRSQQQQQGQQQDQGAPEQQDQQAGDDQGGQQHSRRRSQQQQQQGQQQGAPDQQDQQAGDDQGGQQQHSRRRSQQQQQGQQQDQGAPEQQDQQAGDDQGGQQQGHSRRRSQQQQAQPGDGTEQPAGGQDGTEQVQDQTTPPPLPAEQESTAEQQLEAQGQQGEVDRVRSLRESLQDQLQDVVGGDEATGNQTIEADGNRRDRRRGDRGDGWWDRDEGRDVVERRGGRMIIDLGNGDFFVESVAPDEGGRLLYDADNVEVIPLEDGRTRTIVYRRNGVQIITNRDEYGNIIRRVKRLPDGRDIVLIDNTRYDGSYDPRRPRILRDVPPPIIRIPREQYIVDYGYASEEDIVYALRAPPVQPIERPYTLDEVLQNESVRAYSPRIDLDSITFATGSATIGRDQMDALFGLGEAMEQIIGERPDEVYLIEGHTDAVGSSEDNLILSDQRAEAVATALSQNFDIPPENLITQGYGEEYLKVDTDGPERRNRRATVRRVTELLAAENQ